MSSFERHFFVSYRYKNCHIDATRFFCGTHCRWRSFVTFLSRILNFRFIKYDSRDENLPGLCRLLSVLVIYRGWLDSFTAVKLVGTIRQRLVIFARILSSREWINVNEKNEMNACLADFDGRVYTRSLLTCRFKTSYSTSRQDVLFSARCRYVLFAASSIFAHSILL